MKTFLMIAFLLVVAEVKAQTYIPLAVDSSYAATDTTTWVGIRADRDYSMVLLFRDSANVAVRLDYSFASIAKTSTRFQSYTIVADSTHYVDTLGTIKGYLLRRGGTDNIPAGTYLRLVVTKKTTGAPARPTKTPFFSAGVWETN